MVDLVRAGRDSTNLAREFEPSAQAIRKVGQADRSEGRRAEKSAAADPGLSAAERDELVWLALRISTCAWSATFSLERRPGV